LTVCKKNCYTAENTTTLTALIEAYLRAIQTQVPLKKAPIVQRMSGDIVTGWLCVGLPVRNPA
jgi:hypothetical protein